MAIETYERVRALVLIQADSPGEVAETLYSRLGTEGGDEFVVARADVVHYVYNVVVPVDAATEKGLSFVLETIREIKGVNFIEVVRVVRHIPFPPHDGHGYITEEEAKLGRVEDEVVPGRQGASPGYNAWG